MKRCPNCGGKRFVVITHVTQEWVVDEFESYIRTLDDCIDVTHRADNYDLWECYECAYKSSGFEFEVEK